jgi:hypothetical protein
MKEIMRNLSLLEVNPINHPFRGTIFSSIGVNMNIEIFANRSKD